MFRAIRPCRGSLRELIRSLKGNKKGREICAPIRPADLVYPCLMVQKSLAGMN